MTPAAPRRERPAGVFIVLEGIDGSGKSEQTRRLARTLRTRGESVLETCEPTSGPFGRRYRAWARGEHEASADEVLELFLLDRDEHVRTEIQPALRAGTVVVCDRYVGSTRAYQSAAGVHPDTLERELRRHPVPEPDLALWLRLPVTQALDRLGDAPRERFERVDLLSRVDAAYAELDLVEIDASKELAEVERDILARVDAHLARTRRDTA